MPVPMSGRNFGIIRSHVQTDGEEVRVAFEIHVAFMRIFGSPKLSKSGIEVKIDSIGYGLKKAQMLKVSGDIEKQIAVFNECDEFVDIVRIIIRKNAGLFVERKVVNKGIPPRFIGTPFPRRRLIMRVDAFIGGDPFHHPDVPSHFAESENPLQVSKRTAGG